MRPWSLPEGLMLWAGLTTLFGLALAGDTAMGYSRDGFLVPGLFACGFGGLAGHGLAAGKVWARATMTERAGWVRRNADPFQYWMLVLIYALVAGYLAYDALT